MKTLILRGPLNALIKLTKLILWNTSVDSYKIYKEGFGEIVLTSGDLTLDTYEVIELVGVTISPEGATWVPPDVANA